MSKVTEINNFLNELQKSHNTIHQVDLDTMDYYIDNISNIRLQSGVDEETKDEIEALQNKLISICGRIKAIANRYNQSAEALVVAIATAKKLGTNLVAYSKLDTKVFADAFPERNDTPEDYESTYELDENKVIDALVRSGKIKEELQESWNSFFANEDLRKYSNMELVVTLFEDVFYEEMPEAIKNFLKNDYDLNISHGKYAYGGNDDDIIDDAVETLLKNNRLQDAIKSEAKKFVADKLR